MSNLFIIKDRIKSLGYAFKGMAVTLKEEHNFRIHLFAAILILSLTIYFPLITDEWLWLIICIVSVLSAEMFNTAIEKLADETDPNHDPVIGKIKDVSAGAVLVMSTGAAVIGIIILWPHICPIF